MTRLHLGCGTRYLDGYVNIDYPPSEHTVREFVKKYRQVFNWQEKHRIPEIESNQKQNHWQRHAWGVACWLFLNV